MCMIQKDLIESYKIFQELVTLFFLLFHTILNRILLQWVSSIFKNFVKIFDNQFFRIWQANFYILCFNVETMPASETIAICSFKHLNKFLTRIVQLLSVIHPCFEIFSPKSSSWNSQNWESNHSWKLILFLITSQDNHTLNLKAVNIFNSSKWG